MKITIRSLFNFFKNTDESKETKTIEVSEMEIDCGISQAILLCDENYNFLITKSSHKSGEVMYGPSAFRLYDRRGELYAFDEKFISDMPFNARLIRYEQSHGITPINLYIYIYSDLSGLIPEDDVHMVYSLDSLKRLIRNGHTHGSLDLSAGIALMYLR